MYGCQVPSVNAPAARRRAAFEPAAPPTFIVIAPIPDLCCGLRYAAIWRAKRCVPERIFRHGNPDSPDRHCP